MRVLTGLFLFAAVLCAQNPAGGPEFEVASVKQAQAPTLAMRQAEQVRWSTDNGRFEATNTTLQALIVTAYKIGYDRITGPSWIGEQHYAVMAKLPDGATKEQIPAMLQKLLADRFHLAVHHDQKVEPVYLLVVGKQGPKLKKAAAGESDVGCSSRPGQVYCGAATVTQMAQFVARTSAAMARMAARGPEPEVVERRIDHEVVDQTGLEGLYDLDLQWMPPNGLGPPRPESGLVFPPRDPAVKADSIFGAFERLGLTLQPGKYAFDQLVVDHAERVPTEN